MVSKAVCVSVQGAVRYFEVHLNVADYFMEGEKVNRGQFIGKVAERLGLDEKPITREKFVAFAQCDTVGLGADSKRQRTSEIKYIEFCYSPPKAVSVVAAVDGRVKMELDEAVKEELRWFETLVTVRDRRGHLANEEVTKPTGQMIAALFPHETSRTNDPDFHVHALICNVTWDEERKGYFAIHYGQMLELRKTLDVRIHNNLAARMGKLGYQVETAPVGFGLKEVPAPINAMFCERTRQVETVLALLRQGYMPQQIKMLFKGVSEDEKRQMLAEGAEKLRERMGKPSARPRLKVDFQMRDEAVLLSRPKKVLISSRTLREDVVRRLQQAGLSVEKPFPFPVQSTLNLKDAVPQGEQLAFEKESVVRLDHLLGEIVRLAPGAVSNDELTSRLRDDRHFLIRRMGEKEMVTTRRVLNEEKTLLTDVIRGMGQREPLQRYYAPSASLMATPERIHELVIQAGARGEQLTKAQAEKWLNQFAAIHEYVCTSRDQFLNIRGGAGTGKTFCLEQLVSESQRAYRRVFICAPYGEQARVTLRNEAPRLEAAGHKKVAHAFAQANTVDSLLMQARNDPTLLREADIYCDEAGLLDTPKALALVREAERAGARVIFQGDTEQMAAVGRGQPIKLLQDELKLGMHVPRASISRRQLTVADKQLAADLSSGDSEKFTRAVRQMLDRGLIRQTPPDEAVEKVAREIVEARAGGKEIVAVSSVHRISEALADCIHDLHVEKRGWEGQTPVDVHVKRDLQPAEMRSSQFYKVGDVIEYKANEATWRAVVAFLSPHGLIVEQDGQAQEIRYRQVRAVFDRTRIERGPGEKLLLQEKIKQGERIFEKGSRQTISRVSDEVIHFESGLRLRADDGRVRQGDCLTDYKAQGIKGVQVRGIEDNSSALAMGNKEAFHVKGTRHVQNLVLHVENKGLYVEAIQRGNEKFSAIQLERIPTPAAPMKPALTDKSRLLLEVRDWGREFIKRTVGRKMTEQIRHQLARFEALRPRRVEVVAEKIIPEVKEAVQEKPLPKIAAAVGETPKITPSPSRTPLETPRERLSSSEKEMAPKPQKKPSQSPRLQPRRPALQPKRSPYYHEPAPQPRRGIGI
jgi:conjugative relaxase-like TrwC/TraI family protein